MCWLPPVNVNCPSAPLVGTLVVLGAVKLNTVGSIALGEVTLFTTICPSTATVVCDVPPPHFDFVPGAASCDPSQIPPFWSHVVNVVSVTNPVTGSGRQFTVNSPSAYIVAV